MRRFLSLRAASRSCLCALVVLSASCVSNPEAPKIDAALTGQIPSDWTSARITSPEKAAVGWIEDLGDPALTGLVERAVGENYDLAASVARVKAAIEQAKIANADRLPQLDANLSTNRSQNLRGVNFTSTRANNFNLGLDFAWEVDLWGRVANLRRSALRQVDVTSAEYRAAKLSLAANVAKSALDLITAEKQIVVSQNTISSLTTNLEILDSKLEAGDADDSTALEISLTRADIARAKSTLAGNRRDADSVRRLLETFLGDYPKGTIDALDDFPAISRKIPAGLPSELLLRRPDLIAAERRVDAADEDLAASRKALLPSVRITAGGGTATTGDFANLLNIQNLVWNIGQNLAQPLFQGGRLKARIRLDEADREELAASYGETALTAFREVETALAGEKYLREQVAQTTVAEREAKRAEELSLDQYQLGLVEIITVLESQRRSFDASSSLVDARNRLLQNRIDLYLALGGDFDSPAEVGE